MTKMLNVTHQMPAFGPVPRSRIRPLVGRSLIVTLAAGALVSSSFAPAFADQTLAQPVTANVEVFGIISLTDLDDSFTLSGIPGDTVEDIVEYTVVTNNSSGYSVTVQPQTPTLVGTLGGEININLLSAWDNGGSTGPTELEFGAATDVRLSGGPSAQTGDPLATRYSMTIPWVQSDIYTATLDYVATTNV